MSEENISARGARIVGALEQFAADLKSGTPIEGKCTVRQVRVIPKPSTYTPAQVRRIREQIGASQEVFAQLLAVSPVTVRSWEQGTRQPSPIARRFLDEIAMCPGHFRGRLLAAMGTERASPERGSASTPKDSHRRAR